MDVVLQGESVAFFAGKLPSEYSDESCAEDLHSTLQKNHTRAVHLSRYGVHLLQLFSGYREKDEEDESSNLVLPSMMLNTLKSSSTTRFVERFNSTEEIEPTASLPCTCPYPMKTHILSCAFDMSDLAKLQT